MSVKILGINGSTRKGNTEILVKEALEAAQAVGDVEIEYLSLAELKVADGCIACYGCKSTDMEKLCVGVKNDDVNLILKKMIEADGIIVGAPVYFGGPPAQLKAVIDRSFTPKAMGMLMRNKVGGAIVVAIDRQGGIEGTINDLHRWYLTHDMIIVGTGPSTSETPKGVGCYFGAAGLQGWPYRVGGPPREAKQAVLQDDIGMAAARTHGRRVAELTKVVKAGFQAVETIWPYFGLQPTLSETPEYKNLLVSIEE